MQRVIYINGRFLTQPLTGVQRYCHEITRAMDRLLDEGYAGGELHMVCLAPPGEVALPAYRQVEVRKIGLNRGNLWEQIDLPLYIRGKLLFSPANIGPFWRRNQVATLHDASVFAVPHAYSRLFRFKYRFVFRQLARHARVLLTDSRFSQQELAKYLDVPADRFMVIALAADHMQQVQANHQMLEQNLLKLGEYFLMVSSLSPHKNFARAVQAFLSIQSEKKLVIIGGEYPGVFNRSQTTRGSDQVLWLGGVEDSSLKALYENALGFIHPSLYEGFGFPPLEAMACGCPVLCSNAASLPEICGDAVIYYDPSDVHQIAQAITQLLAQEGLYQELRRRGLERSAQFTWRTAAQKTLDVLLWETT